MRRGIANAGWENNDACSPYNRGSLQLQKQDKHIGVWSVEAGDGVETIAV